MVSKKTTILVLFLLVFLCGLTCTATAGKIYRWKDEKGAWHFSDSKAYVPKQYLGKTTDTDTKPVLPKTKVTKPPVAETIKPKTAQNEPTNGFSIPYEDKEGLASRVIINVTFNGKVTAPMMVDTGSPGMVISTALANRLELFDENNNNLFVSVSGIGGSAPAIRTIVDQIEIGTATEAFIPTHIVANMADAYEGLIGMDILSGYMLTIDTVNKKLVAQLNPSANSLPAGRPEHWWRSNFKEFGFYRNYWDQLSDSLDDHRNFRHLSSNRKKTVKDYVEAQTQESGRLFSQLERHARYNSVPNHWRK